MTKYSIDVHSQPIETPYALPALEKLINDIQILKDWVRECKARVPE